MSIVNLGNRLARNAWRVPVVGRLLAWDYERAFARRPPNTFRGIYTSFAEAEASIPPGARVGYDHQELAGLYRHRMTGACESDYAVLYWLRGILGPGSFVFDFGGHVGVSYHGWRRYLPLESDVHWLVYDMPAIARVGVELAGQLGATQLAFANTIEAGKGCDVFLAAGSLQYVNESLPSLLQRMGSSPRHLFVNKLPLYDGAPFVTVQSTGRAFHAYRIDNRSEFVAGVEALGYRVVDGWRNSEVRCHVPFTRHRNIDAYSGYYFVKD